MDIILWCGVFLDACIYNGDGEKLYKTSWIIRIGLSSITDKVMNLLTFHSFNYIYLETHCYIYCIFTAWESFLKFKTKSLKVEIMKVLNIVIFCHRVEEISSCEYWMKTVRLLKISKYHMTLRNSALSDLHICYFI